MSQQNYVAQIVDESGLEFRINTLKIQLPEFAVIA